MAIEVVAVAVGFYGKLREVGDHFTVKSKADIGRWMQPVNGETAQPESEEAKPVEAGSKPLSAKDIIALIADSDDIEFLNKQLTDERATVSRAATERLAELANG